MRKRILDDKQDISPIPRPGELDIAAIATALLSSEAADHPIENAFDSRRGPGGSRWIAAETGEQTLVLAFDAPQSIREIHLEIEEYEVGRTQELQVALSHDGGQSYRELVRQEYTFSPPGTAFEREAWSVSADPVTHLRLWIKPDKGGKPCKAVLTSLALVGGV